MSKAKELIFRAQRFNATEALKIGLINHAVEEGEVNQKVMDICSDIAKNVSTSSTSTSISTSSTF